MSDRIPPNRRGMAHLQWLSKIDIADQHDLIQRLLWPIDIADPMPPVVVTQLGRVEMIRRFSKTFTGYLTKQPPEDPEVWERWFDAYPES